MKNTFKNTYSSARSIAVILMVTVLPIANGATIFWGSLNNDSLYNSSGNALDSSFSFEIGTFVTGFTPTVSNMSQWQANWLVFDRATSGQGWDPATQTIDSGVGVVHTTTGGSSSSAALPSSVFEQGAEAYLWAFNSKVYEAGSEWALVYSANTADDLFGAGVWEFPDPAMTGDSFDWQTRDLDTAIFGGVENTQGPGNFSVNPGTFTLQTHAIPEPSSALMVLAAGVALRLRRRPQAHSVH
jgi:hypothetical protein